MTWLRTKSFNIMGGSLKNPIFREGSQKTIFKGEFPKKGSIGQFSDLRGAWQKKGVWCF